MFVSSHRPNNMFTDIEDRRLHTLVAQYGNKNWKKIAKMMPGRNPRQCKDRWEKYLSPEVNLGPYTKDEDLFILQQYEQLGPKWMKIGKMMKGRSDIGVKSRYNLLKRHNITIESLMNEISVAKPENSETIQILSSEKMNTDDLFTNLDEQTYLENPFLDLNSFGDCFHDDSLPCEFFNI